MHARLTIIATAAAAVLPLAAVAAPLSSNTAVFRRDNNTGCFDTSFGNLVWGVEDFAYNASYLFTTPAHQNSWGYASFELSNSALTYKATCSASSSQLSDFFYGTQIYECKMPDPEGAGTTTTFSFDYPGRKLGVNQTWSCSDTEPDYPTTFRAVGTITLDLDCDDTGTQTDPNWHQGGGFYSTRYVGCAPINLKGVKPDYIYAIA